MQKQMFSSIKDNWETPEWLFDKLDKIFDFELDAAASWDNALCSTFMEQDALELDWMGITCSAPHELHKSPTVWLNPPYGAMTLKFLKKVKEEYTKGLDIVTLTAARTDTKAFRIIWENAWKVLFFYGRLKFELDGEVLSTAPFPSALAIFSHNEYDLSSLEDLGKIVTLKELK